MPKLTPVWAALLPWGAYAVHALLVLLAAVSHVWPIPLPPRLASATEPILIVLGLVLYGTGAVAMHSLARMSGRRADQLITSGVYRFTRHPQLVGWASVLLGVALWGCSWLALLLVGIYLAGIAVLIPVEERKLVELYGQEYRDYRKRTARIFSWPKG